ncbi:hypothetical protein QN277_025878 [Acacia crassicarpa]|nr:hypothetical protein QN277_025878 [Acacia crassicarpa]
MDKLEGSQFYHDFKDQLQTPQIYERLRIVLGSASTMKMVIYGIGNFESYENPNYQLGLTILMQRDFKWIGDIEVFDPALSMNECQVLEALGCSVLQYNEYGRRKALKPTLFFMPHCPIMLYDNLLQENWKSSSLRNIVILGNSFDNYVSSGSCSPHMKKYIMLAATFTNEFEVKTNSNDYYEDSKDDRLIRRRRSGAFHHSSWHFFTPLM